jgi:hypothetical protein
MRVSICSIVHQLSYWLWAGLFGCPLTLIAQWDYMSPSAVSTAITTLAKSNKNVSLIRYGQSSAGQDLTAIRIKIGEAEAVSPAIAVIAGHSSYYYTTDLALQLAQRLANLSTNDSLFAQLKGRSIFILPNIHTDTRNELTAQPPMYPRGINLVPDDEDKDGKLDEDDFEDVNQDRVISQMRILGNGNYLAHPKDPRIMVQADKAKGQQGEYRLLTEGLDNDQDEQINEDPLGGIDINKQFSFGYPWFKSGAGQYPLSSPEAKALADFLVERPSIQIVLVLGPDNNLTKAWEANDNPEKGVHAADATTYNLLAKQYQKSVPSSKDQASIPSQGGNILQWLHFHMGRWTLGTPGWAVPKPNKPKKDEKKDTLAKDNKLATPETDTQAADLINWLQWMKDMGISESAYFVPWKPFQHPDFPNEQVEIGGIMLYKTFNAPVGMLDSLARRHMEFFGQISKVLHSTVFQHVSLENVGNGVKRLTVKLRHQGFIPPYPQSRAGLKPYALPVCEIISLDSLRFLAGYKRQKVSLNFANAEKGSSISPEKPLNDTLEWLLIGKGKISIRFGSETMGYITRDLMLE